MSAGKDAEPDGPGRRVARLAGDLAALASRRRLRLVHLLTEPRYGAEMAEALGVTRQSALGHVARLERRGFVRSMPGQRPHGPVKEYKLVPSRIYATAVELSELAGLRARGGPDVPTDRATMTLAAAPDAPGGDAADGAPRLVVVSGPRAGARFPLTAPGGRWTVGRDRDADIRLAHDPFVSGRHAKVRLRDGTRWLVDAGSANGTHVNFRRLPEGGRHALRSGDVVRVGHTSLVFQAE